MEQNDDKKRLIVRSNVDRRKVEDRRLCLDLEYNDYNSERRANMIGCRKRGERRTLISDN